MDKSRDKQQKETDKAQSSGYSGDSKKLDQLRRKHGFEPTEQVLKLVGPE